MIPGSVFDPFNANECGQLFLKLFANPMIHIKRRVHNTYMFFPVFVINVFADIHFIKCGKILQPVGFPCISLYRLTHLVQAKHQNGTDNTGKQNIGPFLERMHHTLPTQITAGCAALPGRITAYPLELAPRRRMPVLEDILIPALNPGAQRPKQQNTKRRNELYGKITRAEHKKRRQLLFFRNKAADKRSRQIRQQHCAKRAREHPAGRFRNYHHYDLLPSSSNSTKPVIPLPPLRRIRHHQVAYRQRPGQHQDPFHCPKHHTGTPYPVFVRIAVISPGVFRF